MGWLSSPAPIRLLRSAASTLLLLGVTALLWPSSLGGDVSYILVSGTSMEPGMHTGDLVLVRESDGYDVGDAIAYRVPDGNVGAGSVVIHRIAGGDGETGFLLQGDNRDRPDTWRPTTADVIGERWVLAPALGSGFSRLRSPLPLALAAASLTLLLALLPERRRPIDHAPLKR